MVYLITFCLGTFYTDYLAALSRNPAILIQKKCRMPNLGWQNFRTDATPEHKKGHLKCPVQNLYQLLLIFSAKAKTNIAKRQLGLLPA